MMALVSQELDLLCDDALDASGNRRRGVVDEGYSHKGILGLRACGLARVSRLATLQTFGPFYHLKFAGQGSSEVEQGTHKPLVGSSILPPGTLRRCWRRSSSRWRGQVQRHLVQTRRNTP